jgi:hypothetical protein
MAENSGNLNSKESRGIKQNDNADKESRGIERNKKTRFPQEDHKKDAQEDGIRDRCSFFRQWCPSLKPQLKICKSNSKMKQMDKTSSTSSTNILE